MAKFALLPLIFVLCWFFVILSTNVSIVAKFALRFVFCWVFAILSTNVLIEAKYASLEMKSLNAFVIDSICVEARFTLFVFTSFNNSVDDNVVCSIFPTEDVIFDMFSCIVSNDSLTEASCSIVVLLILPTLCSCGVTLTTVVGFLLAILTSGSCMARIDVAAA